MLNRYIKNMAYICALCNIPVSCHCHFIGGNCFLKTWLPFAFLYHQKFASTAHDTAISRLFCFRYTTNLSPAKFCLQTYTDTYCIFVMTLFHICLKIKQLHVALISEGGGGEGRVLRRKEEKNPYIIFRFRKCSKQQISESKAGNKVAKKIIFWR